MKFIIEAACGCNKGKIRCNNEDNFYFDGKCLEQENSGLHHPAVCETELTGTFCVAVFDGMGGENYGEVASFTAARQLQELQRNASDFIVPEKKHLARLTEQINEAVVAAAQERKTTRMGSTMAALYFSGSYVYVCNLGDSRAYRLRQEEFMQISTDHVDNRPLKPGQKAPLIQYIGIDPEEMLIEPYIAKGRLAPGDQYLICSDGLTDMLTNFEIADIMLKTATAEECADMLIDAALEHGGRDNVTVIVCRVR